MPKTVKVPRSKNLLFKKLTFLYLVFILFIFLTSPGEYINHFPPLSDTQIELNAKLLGRLQNLQPSDSAGEKLKVATLQYIGDIENVQHNFDDYTRKFNLQGVALKESKFAEQEVKKGKLAEEIERILSTYTHSSEMIDSEELMEDLMQPQDYQKNKHSSIHYFFHETPNGAIPSILEHFKTVALYHSISSLEGNQAAPLVKHKALADADFVQKFKRTYLPGEALQLTIYYPDFSREGSVKVNNQPLRVESADSTHYTVNYVPRSSGKYQLQVEMGDLSYHSSFEVLKPETALLHHTQGPLSFILGEESTVILNEEVLPPFSELSFRSDFAKVSPAPRGMKIVPQQAGLQKVEIWHNKTRLGEIEVYAEMPDAVIINLVGNHGAAGKIEDAAYLRADNDFWKVVSYQLTVIDEKGRRESFSGRTPYLSGAALQRCAEAAPGSSFIFENIALVSPAGKAGGAAQSFIITK